MFKYTIVCFLMLTIILFPIPLKITLKYLNKVLEIYIYNKRLMVKTPLKNTVKSTSKHTSKGTSKSNKKNNFFSSLVLSDIKLIIYKIRNLKFKPILILNTKLEYGFDDAALVAIIFGLIHSTYSLFYLMLINFVKVKDMDFQVIPHFEKYNLNMEISSIIYINIAKVIYTAFIMLFCLIKIKQKKINIKKYRGGSING